LVYYKYLKGTLHKHCVIFFCYLKRIIFITKELSLKQWYFILLLFFHIYPCKTQSINFWHTFWKIYVCPLVFFLGWEGDILWFIYYSIYFVLSYLLNANHRKKICGSTKVALSCNSFIFSFYLFMFIKIWENDKNLINTIHVEKQMFILFIWIGAIINVFKYGHCINYGYG